ncbi:hypothetical protein TNIN_144791 [Trichonephila inaurata madagascariensis]|uniref:Uncharacterized protein n=1 Tax=Trichonephila inaurata madagascariensis TaxID=2747483 RepID=A0A8X6Y4C9_9ARAC|nr:hypothetical protein TNIN_144791 [Trichonephila inaurata madagascariensis]
MDVTVMGDSIFEISAGFGISQATISRACLIYANDSNVREASNAIFDTIFNSVIWHAMNISPASAKLQQITGKFNLGACPLSLLREMRAYSLSDRSFNFLVQVCTEY